MEASGFSSHTNQQAKIASFLEIAVGHTADTAWQFLQATGWKLEEAIQLFFVGNEFDNTSSSPYTPKPENEALDLGVTKDHTGFEDVKNDGSAVDAPLPVKPDVLYEPPVYYNIGPTILGVTECPGVWGAHKGSTSAAAETSRDELASLYNPPYALMYHGPFKMAKMAAMSQDRWLLVNVQSTRNFSSHMLNRDTWGNATVAQTIFSHFIFWQVCDDNRDGNMIMAYYKLESVPVTLVIDPITGQKMRLWHGMIQPEILLEDVLEYTDSSPKNRVLSLSSERPRESSHVSPSKIQDETNEDDDEMKLALALSMGKRKDISDGFLKDSSVVNEASKKRKT